MVRKSELTFLDRDLWDYETTKYWMGRLRTNGNRRKCKKGFPDFIFYVKMNPDEIIAQRREDLKSDDPKVRRRWEDLALRFYHEDYERLEKAGRSTWTARTKLSAIQSFFAKHHYNLKFERGEVKKAYTLRKKYEVSNEEARAIYQSLEKWRDRAMFLIAYQNGFLESDICNLNAKDFPLEKLKEPPIYFETVRQKTKTKLQTGFGEDVCFALERYIKLENVPSEGPLFQSVHGKRLQPRFVRDAITPIAKKETSEELQFKDLRDAFHDACCNAALSQRTIDALMGQAPLGARGAYVVRKNTILESHAKVLKELSINEVRARKQEDRELIEETAKAQAKTWEILYTSKNLDEAKEKLKAWLVSQDFVTDAFYETKKNIIELS